MGTEADRERPERSMGHWLWMLLAVLGPLGLAGLRFWTEPDARGYGTHEQLGFGACQVREWIGAPCPGCGVTTAASLAAHGRPFAALWTQPLGFALAAGALVFAVWALLAHVRGRDLHASIVGGLPERWVRVTLLFVLAAWIWTVVREELVG